MRALRRWAPLVGTAVLVASTALRAFGREDLAGPLEGVAQTLGLTDASAVPLDVLAGAGAALTGVVLKIKSQVEKTLHAVC